MAKFKAWSSKEETRKVREKDFEFEGETLTLKLWKLSTPEKYRAYDVAQSFADRFVLNEEGDNDPEQFFNLHTGEPITVSRSLFQYCAVIEAQQPPFIKGEDRYSVEELVGISDRVDEKTWTAIIAFSNKVQGKKIDEEDSKNALAADTPQSSAHLSSTTDATTS